MDDLNDKEDDVKTNQLKSAVDASASTAFSEERGVVMPKLSVEGMTVLFDKEDDRAFILINQPKAASSTFNAGDGKKTTPSAAGVVIHELLDHGLDYVKTGNLDYPATKSSFKS